MCGKNPSHIPHFQLFVICASVACHKRKSIYVILHQGEMKGNEGERKTRQKTSKTYSYIREMVRDGMTYWVTEGKNEESTAGTIC